MDNLSERIFRLSPAKRALFEKMAGAKQIRSSTIYSRDKTESVQLSFAQERLWFLDQLQPGSSAYIVPFALRLIGNLNVTALAQSIGEILRRHEVLRSIFVCEDDKPLQIIVSADFKLFQISLADIPEEQRQAEARRLASEEACRPFDIHAGPLLRATLIHLGPEEHMLLLTMHHIVSDGWSIGIFHRELSVLYASYSKGDPSPLAELPIQYADFAVWQRQWLQGEKLRAHLTFWKEHLKDSSCLNLPADHQRPRVQTFNGATHAFQLSQGVTDAIQGLGRKEGVTLFMTLFATFQSLLHRYTGEDDIIVGMPIANRNRPEIEGLIGFFVNTLVMRTDTSGDPVFRELLKRVRISTLEAYEHQDLPFEKLVEELQPARDLNRSAIFQVMFALQNAPMEDIEFPGLTVSVLNVDNGTAKFDLTLSMSETNKGLEGRLEYNTDLFHRDTIGRMAVHYQMMLEGIASNPDLRLSELPLLTDAERQRLLTEWNSTGTDYPKDSCAHDLFELRVRRTPDAVAAVFERQQLTYRQLNSKANQLAHYLRKMGIGPDVLVGICVERSIDMIVGVLGILKAGGAYVPLDPTYPKERLAFMIADTSAPVILTQQHLADVFEGHSATVVCLDSDGDKIEQESRETPVNTANADNLIYVIYTSGSTGKPKGVCVSHRAVSRLVLDTNYIKIEPSDTVAQASSFTFDAATFEIWGALLNGARLFGVTRDVALSPEDLAGELIAHGISVLFLTTALFNQMARRIPGAFRTLRCLLFGGEAVDPACVRMVVKGGAPQQLLHVYGPTESTTFTSWYPVQDVCEDARTVPIGKPVSNATIYLLDRAMQPVPVGIPGELYIGGDGLARGYLCQPELTAEKFIPDPLSDRPGARMYRSGDLARYLPDGNVEYLGRLDNQVKIRGFRIELGEIEAVLKQHPSVVEAVVVAREDQPGDKRVVAYAVLNESAVTIYELKDFMKKKLPDYMVPSAFVVLDTLPLTASGKVDRNALPSPEHIEPKLDNEHVTPRTATEVILAGIWSEVLHVKQAGVLDNFFELGGHSLLASQMVSRIGKVFEVEIPIRSLFETPTIAGLAESIEKARMSQPGLYLSPILPVSRDQKLPLSFAQQRLWFLDQLEPGSAAYVMPFALRLNGNLNVTALEQSLGEIFRRHEALRSIFVYEDDKPLQIIVAADFKMLQITLADIPDEQRQAEALRFASEEACRPFDIHKGPLLRATLIRLYQEEQILLLTMHHIVSDGWSMGIFYRELSVLYESYSKGDPSPLPKLPIQYVDFAVWQRQRLRGEMLERQMLYWKKQLANELPLLDLPADRSCPDEQDFCGAAESLVLSGELTEGLKKISRKEGVTLFMTLLSAFEVLLFRYTGQEDIVVGSPAALRNRTEIEGLIGFFVNTLALRTDLSGNPSFKELLRRVRKTVLDAYTYQDLPFEKIVEEIQPTRNLNRNPIFDIMFNFYSNAQVAPEIKGLDCRPFDLDEYTSKFRLTLYAMERADTIDLKVVYRTGLFSSGWISNLLEQLHGILEQIIADSARPIKGYSLMTLRSRLLLPDPTTAMAEPQYKPITDLVAEWAELMPEQPAVCLNNRSWGYHELMSRSRAVAQLLQMQGLHGGDAVAVYGTKSFGLIVGIVGVFLSKGVLVTIDPRLPVNRRQVMLKEAGARFIITSRPDSRENDWFNDVGPLAVIHMDQETGHTIDAEHTVPEISCLPDISCNDPAYIFFTSGTSGVPRAVMGSHKGLSHFLSWQRDTFAVGPGDRVAQLTGFSFDVVLRDIFLPLTSGATIYIPDEFEDLRPDQVLSWFEREKITLLHTVPSLAESWLNGIPPDVAAYSLRLVFFAGEPLSSSLVQQWRKTFSEACRIINLYGPTETTLAKCYYEVPCNVSSGVQPLGRPLPHTQAFVLSENRQLCGVGEPGEIALRTPFRTLGYINSPSGNLKRFVRNPFCDDPQDLIYLTGDRGRYRPDGLLEFLGRLDDQVKIRGVRVEPQEISAVLSQHSGVKSCVVVAQKNDDNRHTLVAYVVPSGPDRTALSELRSYAMSRLPAAMVPSHFMVLDALPLTPNGKLDKRALPVPDAGPVTREPFIAPRTALEESLASMWCQVLGLERVGMRDNFFELGGHSLIATQIASRVRRDLNLELTVRCIFEHPTIELLVFHLIEEQVNDAAFEDMNELVTQVESMSRDDIESFLTQDELSPFSKFCCPQGRSKFFGRQQCNLLMIINERFELSSFERLACYVQELDPRINVAVVRDCAPMNLNLPNLFTLIFSPALIRNCPPVKGRIFCGQPLSKSEEYTALEKAGIPVPPWVLLTEEEKTPDLSKFDDYVVRKPNYGGMGAKVVIMKKNRVRWKPIITEAAGLSPSTIVQKFIYTGTRPVSFRVTTLFGKVLSSNKYEASADRPELTGPQDFESASGLSIVASARNSRFELNYDEEIIGFAESAHAAFPEIPLLGFDVLREVPTGKLYVSEANAIGYVWSIETVHCGHSLEEQFDGVRKAAYILAEKTQQLASHALSGDKV
jgi:amino acid adenylation domain-containing protein